MKPTYNLFLSRTNTSIFLLFFLIFNTGISQVGIGTEDPESSLDIRAANHLGTVSASDGVLVPRVNNLTTNGNTDGQLVFLTQNISSFIKGFHYWNASSNAWTPLTGAIEPWYKAGTTDQAVLNTDNIYTMGRVGIGTSNPLGAIHITEVNGRDALFLRFIDPPLDDFDLDIYRSRGTLASPALVTTGTRLGGLRYNGLTRASTFSFGAGAEVSAEADGDFSTTSAPGRLLFQTTSAGSLNTVTRMMIKSDGKIGVNNDIPRSTFDVSGSVSKSFVNTGTNTSFALNDSHYTARITANTTTITLPNPNTCRGRIYVLIKANTTGATFTNVSVTGGATIINDVSGLPVTQINPGSRYTLQSNGTEYIVIGE